MTKEEEIIKWRKKLSPYVTAVHRKLLYEEQERELKIKLQEKPKNDK